jgi:glucosamine--fructose-6-phosphate aminotransferase (isomerizing)
MSGPDALVLVLAGDQRTAVLNEGLVRDVRNAGGKAYIVGPHSDLDALRIPDVAAAIRPILEILPLQLLSLSLAARAGLEPGNFKLLTKVTTIE